MTDEQFDEICRISLACEPAPASEATWSRIRPEKRKWNWLPTVPEILVCGGACGLVLLALGIQSSWAPGLTADSNPVVKTAMGRSLAGLQASAALVPDITTWTEASIALPEISEKFIQTKH
jgi:hypothetical protein